MSVQFDEKVDDLKAVLGDIEMDVLTNYTLADAIREGCNVTTQAIGWGAGETACALTAGVMAAKARGFV